LRKLTYINSSGGELILTNSAPFLLQKFTESGNVDIQNLKGVNQDGLTYLGNTLDLKDIQIEFSIIANSEIELINYRKEVRKILNPKLGEGSLVYTDDVKDQTIKCIITSIPVFNNQEGTYNQEGKVSSCLLSLTAHDPYWFDDLLVEKIATWIGGWKFKFTLPFKFRTKGESKKNIYNDGDIKTPIEIIFRGPAINPSITNLTTNEFIKVNRTLTSDDTLYITTEFFNKTVEIETNGVRAKAFNYIDLDSTFFNLVIGDNMIEYHTDNIQPLEPQSVVIKYKNRYLGV